MIRARKVLFLIIIVCTVLAKITCASVDTSSSSPSTSNSIHNRSSVTSSTSFRRLFGNNKLCFWRKRQRSNNTTNEEPMWAINAASNAVGQVSRAVKYDTAGNEKNAKSALLVRVYSPYGRTKRERQYPKDDVT